MKNGSVRERDSEKSMSTTTQNKQRHRTVDRSSNQWTWTTMDMSLLFRSKIQCRVLTCHQHHSVHGYNLYYCRRLTYFTGRGLCSWPGFSWSSTFLLYSSVENMKMRTKVFIVFSYLLSCVWRIWNKELDRVLFHLNTNCCGASVEEGIEEIFTQVWRSN